MQKLINISTYPGDLERFDRNSKNMEDFLRQNGLQGFEMIQYEPWEDHMIPGSLIKGVHMRYYPVWLDFWRGDQSQLLRQWGNRETIRRYYGGETREDMVAYYQREIETAAITWAQYLVFHVSHAEVEHCMTYRFTYTDMDIAACTIELLNEVFQGYQGGLTLLLENLWWPGLTLKDQAVAGELMAGIRYPHKGFMLDIAHLMNTNFYLQNEEEAVAYILKTLEDLGALKKEIRGIHLNSSLSGDYVLEQLKKNRRQGFSMAAADYSEIYRHIRNIDQHRPFLDSKIKRVIEEIRPEYLVYEFLTKSLEELKAFVAQQNRALMDG